MKLDSKVRKNLKNNFRKLCKRYDINYKTNRLIKFINLSNKHNLKKYYVAYELEKKYNN